jgi:hypothetical protein
MNETTATPENQTTTVKASPEEVKSILAAYVVLHGEVKTCEKATEDAKERCNNLLRDLAEKSGKGKYRVQGDIKTLSSKKSKKTGKEAFFFRGQDDDETVLGGD